MKSNKFYIISWIITVVTFLFIAVSAIISLSFPEKEYFVFNAFIIKLKLPPMQCAVLWWTFVLQTIVVTAMVGVDIAKKTNFKRDFIITTLLGIISIVLVCVPFFGGITDVLIYQAEYAPKYYLFTDNSRSVVIEERNADYGESGKVYYLSDNSEVSKIGEFTTHGAKNNGNYDIKWSDEKVYVTYGNGDSSKETIECNINRRATSVTLVLV